MTKWRDEKKKKVHTHTHGHFVYNCIVENIKETIKRNETDQNFLHGFQYFGENLLHTQKKTITNMEFQFSIIIYFSIILKLETNRTKLRIDRSNANVYILCCNFLSLSLSPLYRNTVVRHIHYYYYNNKCGYFCYYAQLLYIQ